MWKDELISIWESDEIIDLEILLDKIKQLEDYVGKAYIMKVLKETIGDRKKAAELLHISERRLRYILNEKGKSAQ